MLHIGLSRSGVAGVEKRIIPRRQEIACGTEHSKGGKAGGRVDSGWHSQVAERLLYPSLFTLQSVAD